MSLFRRPASPKTTLIVSSYNQPQYLRLALETALDQTRLPDEIVVADDGSRPDVEATVADVAKRAPIPIKFVWQPDDGYRLARSRNNAVAAANGDYLIFVDGDCFLGRRFVADHLRFARPGRYVAGTRVNVKERRRRYIFETGDRSISVWSWGTSKKLNAIRSPLLAAFPRKKGAAGANLAVWRADVERLGGFDEIYVGHGGEDLDFVTRLERAGVVCRKIGNMGQVYHFSHPLSAKKVDYAEIARRYPGSVEADGIRCRPEFGLGRALAGDPTVRVVEFVPQTACQNR